MAAKSADEKNAAEQGMDRVVAVSYRADGTPDQTDEFTLIEADGERQTTIRQEKKSAAHTREVAADATAAKRSRGSKETR